MVEAPDHGHETTSEAFSYWLWLEASTAGSPATGRRSTTPGRSMEKYIIPAHADQPTNAGYDPAKPATYAAEHDRAEPVPVAAGHRRHASGSDPLAHELQTAYGTGDIYGMHWLLDVDNTYGFGRCGDGTTKPAYINTYQRGPQESVWETVPQPSCDTFTHGGPNGYLDLFIKDSVVRQAVEVHQRPGRRRPRRPGRVLGADLGQGAGQAVADRGHRGQGRQDGRLPALRDVRQVLQEARTAPRRPARPGTGKDAAHYLLSWYYAWGGAYRHQRRLGLADRLQPQPLRLPEPVRGLGADQRRRAASRKSPTAASRLEHQPRPGSCEFYTWLQSAEGAIAGGATNSWDGNYATPPAGTADLLRHGLRRGSRSTTTRRRTSGSASRRGRWSGSPSYYYVTGNAEGQGAARQVGALGAWPTPRSAPTAATRSRPTLTLDRPAGGTWNAARQPAGQHRPARRGHRTTARTSASPAPYAKDADRTTRPSRGNAAAQDHGQGAARRRLATASDAKGVSAAGDARPTTTLRRRLRRAPAGPLRPAGLDRHDAERRRRSTPARRSCRIRSFYKNDPDWPKVAGVPERRRRRRSSTTTGSGRRSTWRSPWPSTGGSSREQPIAPRPAVHPWRGGSRRWGAARCGGPPLKGST